MFEHTKAVWKAISIVLCFTLLLPAALLAEEHVVPLSDLRKSVAAESGRREANLVSVRKFLSSDDARKAIQRAGMNPTNIEKAVAVLSDEELARLAARADRARQDIAAGALSNQELTYIVIALATAVLILVIIAA